MVGSNSLSQKPQVESDSASLDDGIKSNQEYQW